jgi:DNA-binding HxlR family transcriptional regulator
MRSYRQYCALAKALDVIGDRWTLLVIRELMLGGPSRYTDLRNGLPGIATNLLSDRLRELEAAGVVAREEAPPPVATTLFSLTERGQELRPLLDALGAWGVPYIAEGPAPEDAFRGRWLAWPAERFLTDAEPGRAPVSIELRAGDGAGEDRVVVETAEGAVRARAAVPGEHADAVLTGPPHTILGLLSGQIDLAEARRRGLRAEGEVGVLERLRPAFPAVASASAA